MANIFSGPSQSIFADKFLKIPIQFLRFLVMSLIYNVRIILNLLIMFIKVLEVFDKIPNIFELNMIHKKSLFG